MSISYYNKYKLYKFVNSLRRLILCIKNFSCCFTSAFFAWHSGGVALADVPIDEEHFSDENFRAYVSSDCNRNSDGVLSTSGIAAKTLINLVNKNIASLQVIEYFTALTSLLCGENQLTELNISNNTALKAILL